jgi:8-oxo-dGTP pyrophosphatase MutT (NUDIX family)
MQGDIRVAVLLQKGGKYLLGKEATPVIRGLWNWQQGKVEDGEDLENAAKREAKEETGFDVAIKKKLRVIENPFPGTRETHVFLGEILSGELSFSEEEILDAQWFDKHEIEEMRDQLTGPWLIDVISSLDQK